MKTRLISTKAEGNHSRFNTSGTTEVIGSIGDDYDSWFMKDLEVFIPSLNVWKPMLLAFKDKDIVPNNMNTYFAEPINAECRERGWNP